MPMQTVGTCLASLGVAIDKLEGCADRDEEFALVKKAYFKKILLAHPDMMSGGIKTGSYSIMSITQNFAGYILIILSCFAVFRRPLEPPTLQ